MTPKEQSEQAQKLWEEQKADFGYSDECRMPFIMGAIYGMQHMERKCHPFNAEDRDWLDMKSVGLEVIE